MKKAPKILDIKVKWNELIANDPELQILLDWIPKFATIEHDVKDGLYYAEYGAYVHFTLHDGDPEKQDGYGGARFDLKMKDGTTKTLHGPWSSRAGVVNAKGFGPCMDVSMTNKPEVMERGYTFCAGAVTIKAVQEWLEKHPETDWIIALTKDDNETVWIPIKKKYIKHPELSGEQSQVLGADHMGDEEKEEEVVDHPEHYLAGGIETIDVIKAKLNKEEFIGFLKGNVIKYITRAGKKKEDYIIDFRKARWYLDYLIAYLEE